MKTSSYYDGIVGKIYCNITPRIWSFGSHHIPVHAISDVIAASVSNKGAAIVSGIMALLCFLGWGAYSDFCFDVGFVFMALMIVFILIALILALYKKVVITVVSKGLKHVIIDASGSSIKNAINLYQAMLTCLNEGEVYNVNLDVFDNSNNESNSSSTISGTIKTVDKKTICPECGAIIPSDAKECPSCGCPESVFKKEIIN